jgi:thioredoxin-like negative regulator of GroEL
LKTSESLNPEYQSRLAWVLYRVRRLPIARELATRPANRAFDSKAEVKREIAGVLIALESYNPALKLLQSIEPPSIDDRLQIARIYSFDKGTIDKSVAELATILNEQPDNVDANLLLAENLMLTKKL